MYVNTKALSNTRKSNREKDGILRVKTVKKKKKRGYETMKSVKQQQRQAAITEIQCTHFKQGF